MRIMSVLGNYVVDSANDVCNFGKKKLATTVPTRRIWWENVIGVDSPRNEKNMMIPPA